jgi:hypothetical protein
VPALTNTSLTINLEKRGASTNKPSVSLFDLSVGREFKLLESGLKISPKAEFFNLLNAATVTSRSTTVSGTGSNAYLNPNGILSPRMVRLGMQLNF